MNRARQRATQGFNRAERENYWRRAVGLPEVDEGGAGGKQP